QPSVFVLSALSEGGTLLGKPWVIHAGRDDRMRPNDDAFVRRFVARQSAFGCPSIGDCSGATYLAEVLVQLRHARDPKGGAHRVPENAKALRLSWNRLPNQPYVVELGHQSMGESVFAPGFRVELESASAPANGEFYQPGETVS